MPERARACTSEAGDAARFAASIRAERPADRAGVHAVNAAAFPTAAEADLVDALRDRASPLVSIVAEGDDGRIVGHILFSPVTLDGHAGLRLMGLGPTAVLPPRQRRGLGSALVRAGLDACGRLGLDGVVVLGHPAWYPRFGFVPASRFGLRCEFDAPDEAFMALELRGGALDGVAAGTLARYHPAFAGV